MLTTDELAIIKMLAETWNAFVDLPNRNSDDDNDFRFHIHALQRQIMARGPRRDRPDLFNWKMIGD